MKVESRLLSLDEVCVDRPLEGITDPDGMVGINDGRKAAFRNCPMWKDGGRLTQIVGIVGNEAIGRLNVFPLEVVADGKVFSAVCGDSLFVREKFRNTLYAVSLMTRLNTISGDRLSLSAGFSPKARQVIKAIRNTVFLLNKYIVVRRTRSILPTIGRRRLLSKFSWLFDLMLAPYHFIMRMANRVKIRGFQFEEIPVDDRKALAEFAKLIENDEHRFRENMTSEVLDWILHNDFVQDRLIAKRVFGYKKGGRYVAFIMTREGRTSSGCRIGRVFEWQTQREYRKYEPYFLLDVMYRSAGSKLDCMAIEVGDEDAANYSVFKGFLPGGIASVISIGVGKDSPFKACEGYGEMANWRLRSGMGDLCFW